MTTVIDFNGIAWFCHILMSLSLFSGRFMWAKVFKQINTCPHFLILRPFFLRNHPPKPQPHNLQHCLQANIINLLLRVLPE